MPKQEITVVVEINTEPTKEIIEILGRNAARGILEYSGSRKRYADHTLADSVRFNGHEWESRNYLGPNELREWAVTQDELESWDRDEEEDDDDW